MKKIKLLLTFGLLVVSSSTFASEIKKSQISKREDNKEAKLVDGGDTTACCMQTATGGVANSPSYVSVTVTKCHGGKTHNDAKVAACHNALAAAQKSVLALKDTSTTVIPK